MFGDERIQSLESQAQRAERDIDMIKQRMDVVESALECNRIRAIYKQKVAAGADDVLKWLYNKARIARAELKDNVAYYCEILSGRELERYKSLIQPAETKHCCAMCKSNNGIGCAQIHIVFGNPDNGFINALEFGCVLWEQNLSGVARVADTG